MSKGAGRCVATLVGQVAPPSRTACLRARTPVHQPLRHWRAGIFASPHPQDRKVGGGGPAC